MLTYPFITLSNPRLPLFFDGVKVRKTVGNKNLLLNNFILCEYDADNESVKNLIKK